MKTPMNKVYLYLHFVLTLALVVYMRQETNRVNSVSDYYLDNITYNSWLVGCFHGSNGDFTECRYLAFQMDFKLLRKKLDHKKIGANEISSQE